MTQRITKSIVDRMKSGEQLWDADVKGFGVRCQGTTPSFMLKTRVQGKQRWVQIGKLGSPWTVETARREALRLLSLAQQGEEPRRKSSSTGSPRQASTPPTDGPVASPASTASATSSGGTVAQLAERFLAEHGTKLKPRSREEYARLLRLAVLPAFGDRNPSEIARADVSRFHASLSKTPRKANYAVAALSAIINWSIDNGHCPEIPNPCQKLKKFRETSRERFLTEAETATLFAVLDTLDAENGEPTPFTTAIRLLLLTGARLSEILTLKWSYVDVERATLWLPDSKTGKKAIHLNSPALEVLAQTPRLKGNPYVIPGDRDGAHLVNLQKAWRRIRATAGLDDVRIHDLRHTFASVAINSGASLSMVGKLLGHRQPQTTMRYAHLTDEPLRALNSRIGERIAGSRSTKS